MRLTAACHLVYQATDLTPSWLYILPASTSRQTLLTETLHLTPAVPCREGHDAQGNRFLYLCIPPGRLTVDYEVTAQLHSPPPLNVASVPSLFLQPSRYCCPLQAETLALDLFGREPINRNLAERLILWVRQHLSYRLGSSSWETSAIDTLVGKEGVCRDFAHSAIVLSRALGIPARYTSNYALDLNPQDFHACCELFVEGEWLRFDPTGLACPETNLVIVQGRDAGDAPVATFNGRVNILESQVQVREAVSLAQTA